MKHQLKTKQIVRLACAIVGLTLLSGCASCRRSNLPAVDSPLYRDYVRAFFVGLSALQAGDDVRAKASLQKATELVPGEPAGWVNLAILELKQKLYEPAAEHLEKARVLAPDLGAIYFLQATLESNRGNYDAAIKQLRRAVELDPKDVRSLYALAQELERQSSATSDQEAQSLYQKILTIAPNNTAALLDLARLSAKRGDLAVLTNAIGRLRAQSAAWPADVKTQFAALESAASSNPAAAATQVAFLRNVLLQLPSFRQDLFAVKLPPEIVAEPLSRFIKLPSPLTATSVPDLALNYTPETSSAAVKALWAASLQLNSDGKPILAWQDLTTLHLDSISLTLPTQKAGARPAAIVAIDLNYDFRVDLVAASAGGLRLFMQLDAGGFRDTTADMKIPTSVSDKSFAGVWSADIDLDGDLDIVLAPTEGAPMVLQNKGDSTFGVIEYFGGISRLRDFAYGDLDEDGDPDVAAITDDQKLTLWSNERGGVFKPWPFADFGSVAALAIGDLNGDDRLDLVTVSAAGRLKRSSADPASHGLATVDVARWSEQEMNVDLQQRQIILADLDNNGSNDIIVRVGSGSHIFLGERSGTFVEPSSPVAAGITSATDLNDDGLLDLTGVDYERVYAGLGKGTKNYHWQSVRPHAATATGDQRINSFGIGAEMELRAGLLYQKQLVTGPVVHFGLGDQPAADVIRIVWPNGSVQAEFDMKPDQSIAAEQRLKGSCPHLFAWDGRQMRFIKDAPPWSPALGLKINAQVTAGIGQTEEWFKLPGDAVAPAADGQYDLRITAELWETFYIDRYSLMVVDHPAGTEVFTDERFAIPAPALKPYLLNKTAPFARATDDDGADVSATVAALDENYLDTFGRGQYQGLARDHFVELELPANALASGPLYLIAQGWLHPTDASVNVALGQSSAEPPHGLSIEIPDGRGGWKIARDKLGFPAGKFKNLVLDLTGVFPADSPRKFRLRTNLEIYWDRLSWAGEIVEDRLKTQRIELSTAELTHRGFSVMTKANASSPEIPHYEQIETTGQKWRDLEGYYTRFGNILELLNHVDGRFVLVNAGDEIRLRFASPPPPAAGMVRDFILVGNGWIKDGDLNSGFSKTVLPLPTLDLTEYTRPPGRLEDEPAFRANPADWQNYHTRYVAPDQFRNAMRSNPK